jgi:hypothetical protein
MERILFGEVGRGNRVWETRRWISAGLVDPEKAFKDPVDTESW